MDLEITRKQQMFIDSDADEVLYGGAAGGGKSYGQLIDALLNALKYPGIKQLILRRNFPDLEKSLIRVSQGLYSKEIASYNESKHIWKFVNGSIIDFGYCDKRNDVYQYQSAEYDIIRFDELTHFEEFMYIYLISRVRGANDFPKQVKSSTNPGGVGHEFVKKRFIDIGEPMIKHELEHGSRIFIPSLVQENIFLMKEDPGYLKRLENLPEDEKRKLLYGDWDHVEGQYFSEFDRKLHVCKPFAFPDYWTRYRVMDYGLDMLACYWVAVDEQGRAYFYDELYEKNLIIREAAEKILTHRPEDNKLIQANLAPPDLWGRSQDTGKSRAETFAEHGLLLVATKNDRITGWYQVKEWLHPVSDEFGNMSTNLKIFPACKNLIRCLPAVQKDLKNMDDVAKEPHELTHSVDALRYFCAGRPLPAIVPVEKDEDVIEYDDEVSDFINYGG